MRMKILWLSSVSLSNKQNLVSGTWVPGLLHLLKGHYGDDLLIENVTYGNVKKTAFIKTETVNEWIIPKSSEMTSKTVRYIEDIISRADPDIIQIWGTEDIWGDFPFKELVPDIPVILEIQGVLASVSEEYYGGLTIGELIKCWNIKEFLKPSSSLPAIRRLYTKNVKREERILKSISNIGVQSAWSADVVKSFNRSANLFKSGIALRPAFYTATKWRPSSEKEIRIFSTALIGQPLKGGLILFKAFAIVKQRFPEAKLILAGARELGIRRSGFCRMLTKFAQKHGFWDSVIQLGPASAEQLVEQYQKATVFVNPSNWESYSVVTAEAMYIGCPTVAAYSGAMPELGQNKSVLYFPKGDHRICASRIIDILENPTLSEQLSKLSIEVAENRQNRNKIAENQMSVYKKLLKKKNY